MKLFVSYGRRDQTLVDALVSDLERSANDVLIDRAIIGGQRWWDALLERIEQSDAVVFALSPSSLASKACRAELEYANALRRPVVPVMIADTNVDLAPESIGATQIVDYRERRPESAIELLTALSSLEPSPLPEPRPVRPLAPVTDLAPAREMLARDELTQAEQQALLADLAGHKDELDQLPTLHALLNQFRNRPDIYESTAHGVDELVAALPVDDERLTGQRVRRPTSQRDPESIDRLRSLVTHVRAGRFTPILGHGLNDRIIGSRRSLARRWSRSFEFPMAEHQRDSPTDVAQFVAVMTNVDTLRSSLQEYLLAELADRQPQLDGVDDTGLVDAMRRAWRAGRDEHDPYVVLAGLPCPIYVNANPWSLMSDALTDAGRHPVQEVCRWREDADHWPPSVFDAEPGYTPSRDRPLVFHVFGSVDVPDSLVLTQDDFDDYQIAIAENRSIIPSAVQRVLANSAIMLLGFDLEERDVRVLMRSLVGQEGSKKLDRYSHVAAQLEFTEGVTSPERARRYLERYFTKYHEPSIDVFWGTVDEFAYDLAELWSAAR